MITHPRYTLSFDRNGNRTLTVKVSPARAFRVQTNGNLPRTHRDGIGLWTSTEVVDFVSNYGTQRQKIMLGI